MPLVRASCDGFECLTYGGHCSNIQHGRQWAVANRHESNTRANEMPGACTKVIRRLPWRSARLKHRRESARVMRRRHTMRRIYNKEGSMRRSHTYWVFLLSATLIACGTTSEIKPGSGATAIPTTAAPGKVTLDLSVYDRVFVLDFIDATDKSDMNANELRNYIDTVARADRTFPDLIAQRLRDTGIFMDVIRGPGDGKALVISGRITRLTEGNGALRLFIGMGAGSSYFNAVTDLADSETRQSIGQVLTDKNSWPLGGALAATQTVEAFMEGAAKRIASEVSAREKMPQPIKAQ